MQNIDEILNLLRESKLPKESEIKSLCDKAKEILVDEDNVVILNPPIKICGDIHGQFYDLLELFAVGGDVPESSYCFLGDYVDRGHYSLQTFLYLLALKIKHPGYITLLRGNHESYNTTQNYGFYDECIKTFGFPDVYNCIIEVFEYLPLSALINQQFFAVHGGLSPKLETIDEINYLNRKSEIPTSGIFSDLMWSDPDESIENFVPSNRGAGYLFGENAVDHFNQLNALTCILRAHQLCHDGYQYWFNEKLLTIWSAPNYMYRCGNIASILDIGERMEKNFLFFKEAPANINLKRDENPLQLYFL